MQCPYRLCVVISISINQKEEEGKNMVYEDIMNEGSSNTSFIPYANLSMIRKGPHKN